MNKKSILKSVLSILHLKTLYSPPEFEQRFRDKTLFLAKSLFSNPADIELPHLVFELVEEFGLKRIREIAEASLILPTIRERYEGNKKFWESNKFKRKIKITTTKNFRKPEQATHRDHKPSARRVYSRKRKKTTNSNSENKDSGGDDSKPEIILFEENNKGDQDNKSRSPLLFDKQRVPLSGTMVLEEVCCNG